MGKHSKDPKEQKEQKEKDLKEKAQKDKAQQAKKVSKKKLWRIPYRTPPCKGCPALDGGICLCAKKKIKT